MQNDDKKMSITLEDMLSMYMSRFFALASNAKRENSVVKIQYPRQIIEEIMQEAEVTWVQKMKLYAKQPNMQKATMRNILKHSRENYTARCVAAMQEMSNARYEDYRLAHWFEACREGFLEFGEDLPAVMERITGFKWVNTTLSIKEGRKVKDISVTVPKNENTLDIYNKEYDFEDEMYDRAGNPISLQNFFAREIENRHLIIRGDSYVDRFDCNAIKLHPSYIHSLPSLSMPIKSLDVDYLKVLAEKYDSAEEELDKLRHFDHRNDGNRYFELFPKLEGELKAYIEGKAKKTQIDLTKQEDIKEYKQQARRNEDLLENRLQEFRESKLPNTEIYLVKQ